MVGTPYAWSGAMLPGDSHVHSEWSWDAALGDMRATCLRATEMGLPAVAFTEHVDHTAWLIPPDALAASSHLQLFATDDGSAISPPRFDAAGYFEAIDQCRDEFPGLRILTGLEMGEPHRHADELAALLSTGQFDRLLGSLHSLPFDERFSEPGYLYTQWEHNDVVRAYLAEVPPLLAGSDAFEVLAHIEYPARYWPGGIGQFDWRRFEDEFRAALHAVADAARVLEVNTGSGVIPLLVQWWREEGGRAVSFGSDAHDPDRLAHDFVAAAAMVEAAGFRPGAHPWDFWVI